MSSRLSGKVAVITGGASGIGAATVARFLAEGASVVVADIQVEPGQAVAAAGGDQARFVACDVTDESQVVAAIEAATTTWGRLDVMVNNAGIIGSVGPIASTDSAAWHRTIDVLLSSVFYGCKHASGVMLAQGSGSIISTTSIAGVMGGLGPHAYTAAKSAVIGLTRSVASEVGAQGVRCNAIAPGAIPTALTAHALGGGPDGAPTVAARSKEHYGVASDPSDIANAALYLASDESRLVNGHTLVVDAGRSINGGSVRFSGAEAGIQDIVPALPHP